MADMENQGSMKKMLAFVYSLGYSISMNTVIESGEFHEWLEHLKDLKGKFAIIARLRRAELGNFGDHKSMGGGLYEMRIPAGPGYRVYYAQEGAAIYVLLCGGDKSTQSRDIEKARALLAERSEV